MGQLLYTSLFRDADAGGGGGTGLTLDYSVGGEQPIIVADFSNNEFGYGPGGATAPTKIAKASFFSDGTSGLLSATAVTHIDNARSACTMVMWGTYPTPSYASDDTLIEIADEQTTTPSDRMRLFHFFSTSNWRVRAQMSSAGSTSVALNSGSINGLNGAAFKLATRFAANDVRHNVGGSASTDTSATMPAVALTDMSIGGNVTNVKNWLSSGGVASLVVIYAKACSNTEVDDFGSGAWAPA